MIPDLSAPALEAFLNKAELLRHSREEVLQGTGAVSYFEYHSFAEGGKLACNATDEERILRQQSFFNTSLQSRSRLGQGIHDRGESVVFAAGSLLEKDKEGLERHFPAHVKSISVLHKVVEENQIWDLTVSPDHWGLDHMEELYVLVNIGRLELRKGASLIIRGNVLSLLCQDLVCEALVSETDYHIGILPTPYSVDSGGGSHNGADGRLGFDGADGDHGLPYRVEYGLLGAWVPHPEQGRPDGSHGENGADGSDGNKGRNGGMCKLAEITIRQLTGPLRLFSQAGSGGHGGNGGPGGAGGRGGNGTDGIRGFHKDVRGGCGGNGADGGKGGRGGNGGHGGISSNIYLRIPGEQKQNVEMIASSSLGGRGGEGGCGGKAGRGGQPGKTMDPVNDPPIPGLSGRDGEAGKKGLDGKSRPAAHLYLNDEPY